jgi:hypothetical protein
MKEETPMRRRSGAIIPGLFLILLGLWFLADNLGLPLPGFGQLWPVLIILAGLGFWAGYLFGSPRDPGLTFVGMGALLVGLYFLPFTLHIVEWGDMAILWPGFVLIGGLSFLVLAVAEGFKDWGTLAVGFSALAVGVIAFVFTLGLLPAELGLTVTNFWPLILVFIGLIILVQNLLGRSRQ